MRRILLQNKKGIKKRILCPKSSFCLTISNEKERKKNVPRKIVITGVKKKYVIKNIYYIQRKYIFIHIFIPHQIYNNIKLTFWPPEALHRYKHNTQVTEFCDQYPSNKK